MMRKMIYMALGLAVLGGSASVAAFADTAVPTTKAACKKAKDMKWDATTKTCIKK